MPRYKLTVEYDGRDFVGWQRQDNGPSVQAAIEAAIGRFCGQRAEVVGAGRTDAGVHAVGQVAHVDLDRPWPEGTVRAAINFHLKPSAVAIVAAEQVPTAFHARFSAIQRVYRYRILNRPGPPAIDRGHVWWVPVPLALDPMRAGAARLEGHHDFSAFRSVLCQSRSARKTLERLRIQRQGDEILIEARARSFLHSQVRIIVGTLKRLGEGKLTVADVEAALESGIRARAGPTAPAAGLTLMAVHYPPFSDPARSVQAIGDGADDEAEQHIQDDDAEGGKP